MATMFHWMFAIFVLSSLQAGVVVTKVAASNVAASNVSGHIHVEVNGKPFTDFYYGQAYLNLIYIL